MQRLLLIEKNSETSQSLKIYLSRLGYKISVIVRTAEQAIENVRIFNPDFIVMEYSMQGELEGHRIYDKIRQVHREIPIIYLSLPQAA